MSVRDLLIALVRYAIKGEALDKSAVEAALNSEKLATLYKVAKGHDVAHLVAYALMKNAIVFDGTVWQLFLKELEQAKLRYEMIQADTMEIYSCLEKEGIEYIPLKGAVIRSCYPEPWMRTSCDIDILVKKENLDRAIDALVRNCHYTTDRKITYHDVSLYSPFGMHLELHFNINENISKYDVVLEQVWEYSCASNESAFKYLQNVEFLTFHMTAHSAYHFVSGGCGLRSVLDLWLLKQRLGKGLDELLEKAELSRFYSGISQLGEYWFGEKRLPSNMIEEIEKYVLLGGAYGTRGQGIASGKAKRGSRFKYYLSRIFLPYSNMAVLHPVLKEHKILLPLCHIARWTCGIFKRKKIKNELEIISSISEDTEERITALMKDLGL